MGKQVSFTEIREGPRLYLVGNISLVLKKFREEHEIVKLINENPHPGAKKSKIISDKLLSRTLLYAENFPFSEVPKESLSDLRNSSMPGFILKDGEKYFYTQVRADINFSLFKLINTGHCCAKDCSHCSARPYEEGGCPKIFEYDSPIENYDFITKGYETFNCKSINNIFFVISCSHYEKVLPRKKANKKELDRIHSDFEDYASWFLETANQTSEKKFF